MVPFLVTGSVQLHAWSIYLVRAGTQVLPRKYFGLRVRGYRYSSLSRRTTAGGFYDFNVVKLCRKSSWPPLELEICLHELCA